MATTIERPRPAANRGAEPVRGGEVGVKTINLALQGGGAHGAFAWGVLDRLLEDERIAFEGVSATSAGAMNATVLAYGLAEGGREGGEAGARQLLAAHQPCRHLQPAAAFGLRPAHPRPHARAPAGLRRAGPDEPPVLALSAQSLELQSAAPGAGAVGRLRAAARGLPDQALSLRDQCAHRQGPALRERADHRRCRDGLGLPALHVPGRRDRRRGLLGRRLHGQSRDLPAHLQLRQPRRRGRAHQPDVPSGGAAHRARHPEPHQRDLLQLLADARDAGHRLRHAADRRRQARRPHHAPHADPRHQRRRA